MSIPGEEVGRRERKKRDMGETQGLLINPLRSKLRYLYKDWEHNGYEIWTVHLPMCNHVLKAVIFMSNAI